MGKSSTIILFGFLLLILMALSASAGSKLPIGMDSDMFNYDNHTGEITDNNGLVYLIDNNKIIINDERELTFVIESEGKEYKLKFDKIAKIEKKPEKYTVSTNDTDDDVYIEQIVDFYESPWIPMKLIHKVKNNKAENLTDPTYYYLFSLKSDDVIEVNHSVCDSKGVCEYKEYIDREDVVNFNGEYDFWYEDLTLSGFMLVDVDISNSYLRLGFKYTNNVMMGQEVVLDPVFSTSDIESLVLDILDTNKIIIAYCDETSNHEFFQIAYANGTSIVSETQDGNTSWCDAVSKEIGIAVLDTNTFVYTFWDPGTENDMYGSVKNSSGHTLVSNTLLLNYSSDGKRYSHSLAPLNNTNFVFAYNNYSQAGGNMTAFKIYNRSLHEIVGQQEVEIIGGTGAVYDLDVTAMNNTHFAYMYSDSDGADVSVVVLNLSGHNLTSIGEVEDEGSYASYISALDNTNFVMGWAENTGYMWTQVRNTSGDSLTSKINVSYSNDEVAVPVATINSSAYVVGFEWNLLATPFNTSYAIYNESGGVILGQQIVSATIVDNIYRLRDVASENVANDIGLCDDALVYAWVNTTSQAIWKAYLPNGSEWNGECSPPTVTLTHPSNSHTNNTATMTFTCSATPATNISLYTNASNGWSANASAESDSLSTILPMPDGEYIWNCYACNGEVCGYYSSNYSLTIDLLGPNYSTNSTNTTYVGYLSDFRLNWSDVRSSLSMFILSHNNSGTWANETSTSFGSSTWSNHTVTLNSTPGLVVGWKYFANDSADNWNVSEIFTLTTLADNAPQYSMNFTNTSKGSLLNQFALNWTDSVDLSGYVFSWNNSGEWENDTDVSMTGSLNWSNVTHTLNTSVGLVVGWKIFANDSKNQWNVSSVFTETITSVAPTITYVNITNYNGSFNSYTLPQNNVTGSYVTITVNWTDPNTNEYMSCFVCEGEGYDTNCTVTYIASNITTAEENFTFTIPINTVSSFNNTLSIYVNDTQLASSAYSFQYYENHNRKRPTILLANLTWLINKTASHGGLLFNFTLDADPDGTLDASLNSTYLYLNNTLNWTGDGTTNATLNLSANKTYTIYMKAGDSFNLNSSNTATYIYYNDDGYKPRITIGTNGTDLACAGYTYNFLPTISDAFLSQCWYMNQTAGVNTSFTCGTGLEITCGGAVDNRWHWWCANDSAGQEYCFKEYYDVVVSSSGPPAGGGSASAPTPSDAAHCLNSICEVGEDETCGMSSDLMRDCDGYCNIDDDPNHPFADQLGSPDCPIEEVLAVKLELAPRMQLPSGETKPAPYQAIGSGCRQYSVKNIGNVAGWGELVLIGQSEDVNGIGWVSTANFVNISWTQEQFLEGEVKDLKVCVDYPEGAEGTYTASVLVKSGELFGDKLEIIMSPPLITQVLCFIGSTTGMAVIGVMVIIITGVVIFLILRREGKL